MPSPSPHPPRVRSPGRRSGSRAEPDAVSPLTVHRLSVYLRSLRSLEEQGVRRISSQQLARRFHLSPTQIRKDLAQFGGFGVRGVGYDVARLAARLSSLLQLERVHRLVIVGMGNVGTALALFPAFNSGSFRVVAGFDTDPAKVGQRIGRIQVHAMRELPRRVAELAAEMAILAVPAAAAPEAFQALVEAGVRAVLNFAPVGLPRRGACRVKNLDLRIHLEELAFYLGGVGDSTGSPPEGV